MCDGRLGDCESLLKVTRLLNRFIQLSLGCSFDLLANTDTEARGRIGNGGIYGDSRGTRTTDMRALWTARRLLKDRLKEGYRPRELIDLGCGTGRALIFFARTGWFERLAGVEIESSLSERARKNIKSARTGHSEIDIIPKDILEFDFSERHDVVFMFNPFGEKTFRAVIERLLRQSKSDRPLYIVYVNPELSDVLEELAPVGRVWSVNCERPAHGLRVRLFEISRERYLPEQK